MPSLGLGLGLHKQQMLKKSSFILDDIDANMLYFSFSKIHKDDTVCIRVRRDSDNTEKDIGFKNNFLDIDDLLNFVGSGNGYVSVTYAQGQTSSFQNNLPEQPLIVENGIYLGCAKFSGAQWLDTGVTRFGNTGLFADENEEFTVITVTKNEREGAIIARAVRTVEWRTFQIHFSSEINFRLRITVRGARTDTSIYPNSENKIITCIWDKSNLNGYINGEFFPVEVGSTEERTEQRIIVGERTNGTGGYLYKGDITAFIILDKALTTEERQKVENYLSQQFNL